MCTIDGMDEIERVQVDGGHLKRIWEDEEKGNEHTNLSSPRFWQGIFRSNAMQVI